MLSVVIPVYGQSSALEQMLAPLSDQLSKTDAEVVVVDDGSPDPVVLPGFAQGIRLVRHRSNRGRAAARNTGLQAASGDRVLFLDADSLPHSDLLQRHADPSVSALALIGQRYEARWNVKHRALKGAWPEHITAEQSDLRFDSELDGERAVAAVPWLFAHTHNISYPRADLDAIGGFDEQFVRWGWEDTELAYRMFLSWGRDAARFRFDPSALCCHLPHFADRSRLWDEGQLTGLRRFQEKHVHADSERLANDARTYALTAASYAEHLGRDRPAADDLAAADFCRRRRACRRLWVGSGSTAATCNTSLDLRRPLSSTNLPLLGIRTPLDDGAFDEVVFWDDWRVLTIADLSRCVLEAFRLAPRVVFAATEWTVTAGLATIEDVASALEAGPFEVVGLDHRSGVAAVEVRTLTSAAGFPTAAGPDFNPLGPS